MKQLNVFTDGGARGNPGPAACGVVIYESTDNGFKKIAAYGKYLGVLTNNQAEYQGVILALEKLLNYKDYCLNFFLDSELLVKQLNQQYRVKDLKLGKLFLTVWQLKANYQQINFYHVPREKNQAADEIVNKELDQQEQVKIKNHDCN